MSQALVDGNYDELVDPRLDDDYNPMELARMVACAAACVRHSAKRRPKMSQVQELAMCSDTIFWVSEYSVYNINEHTTLKINGC